MLLVELYLVLRGLRRLLLVFRGVHGRRGLLRRGWNGSVIGIKPAILLKYRLLLKLILRRTYRLSLLLLFFLKYLWQVRLALKCFVRRALVALLHLRHACVDDLRATRAILMDQLRRLIHRSIVVSSLHSLDLPLKFRGAACVDWRDLLVANEHGVAIDALAEAYIVMLTSTHTAVACLRAHDTIEQVCVAISLRFGTLVTDSMASTSLARGALA